MAAAIELLGLTASEAISFALGVAMGPALRPLTQQITNESWSEIIDATNGAANMPLYLAALGEIVAEDIGAQSWGEDEAKKQGVNPADFDKLAAAARHAPGLGELLTMLRRDTIDDDKFRHGLRKARFEEQWDAAVEELKNVRLSPAELALGIVRGLLDDPGFLPVNLDTAGGNVPAYGVSTIDAVAEAGDAGISRERLRILVGEIGLPMALDAAAQSVFRGILKRADFNRAVLEGDTRPEWADAILAHARQIPSIGDYVQARIRGWINDAEMYAGTAKHGMSQEDTHLLYLRAGRPAAPGQMATAAARGIDGPDGTPMDRAQFLKGIAESDIRPEWGPMLWESRFLYPPLFQITRLVQAGAITAEVAKEWATKDRYAPEVVDVLYTYWSTPQPTTATSHTSKAQTQLFTDTHRAYKTGDLNDADATTALRAAGVPEDEIVPVLKLWAEGATIQRKLLTPAQIKKAVKDGVNNPATGAPYTTDEGIALLIERGYTPNDAATFLAL